MTVEIIDSWPAVTENDLRAFEEFLEVSLPDDYRRFLLQHNGGHFADEVVFEANKGDRDLYIWAPVEHFHALSALHKYCDLRWNYDTFVATGRIPISCLPIGSSVGGEICLVVSGEYRGEVWGHQRDNEPYDEDPDEDAKWESLSPQASSFDLFLAGLRGEPKDPVFTTPICRAAETGDLDTLRTLLESGVEVDSRASEEWAHGQTPLMVAAYDRRLAAMKYLIDSGADVEARDDRGWPASVFALRASSPDALTILLRAGADPNAADSDGQSLLAWAVAAATMHCPQLLLDAGADINARDGEGRTVLAFCREEGEEEYIPFLEAAGASE